MTIQLTKATIENSTELHTILVENNICYHKSKFKQDILKGWVYCIQDGEIIIGTITLLPNRPNSYPFGVGTRDEKVWYIQHFGYKRLSLDYSVNTIFLFIEQQAQKEQINHLFLETTFNNSEAIISLESIGFTTLSQLILSTNQIFMVKTL